jgi:DNA polymerase-3 subunit delta'
MQRGDTAFVKDWSAPQLIDALHKLCHDMMTYQCGAEPRFFDAASLCKAPPLRLLSDWSKELSAAMRTMEHPFNAGLMQEALVAKAKSALNSQA